MKISCYLARPVKLVPICLLHFLLHYKHDAFSVLFSIDIVVSVKRFVMISLKRQQCQLKIRQQTGQALDFQQFNIDST